MPNLFHFHNDKLRVDHNYSPEPKKGTLYMHAHDVLEIYYFLSGDVEFSVEGNVYNLRPEDVMIVRSAETHRIETNPGTPYDRMTIHIDPNYFSKFCPEYKELLSPFFQRRLGMYNQYHADQFAGDHWRSCLRAIADHSKECALPQVHIEANLFAFLTELNVAYGRRDLSESKTEVTELSRQIIQYINNHIFEPISVLSICEAFHVSETHLNRMFNKATGTSVWKYIRIKRLIAAREQICAGVPALDASANCGFGDYSAFFRAYKAMFSASPQDDFRKTKLK